MLSAQGLHGSNHSRQSWGPELCTERLACYSYGMRFSKVRSKEFRVDPSCAEKVPCISSKCMSSRLHVDGQNIETRSTSKPDAISVHKTERNGHGNRVGMNKYQRVKLRFL